MIDWKTELYLVGWLPAIEDCVLFDVQREVEATVLQARHPAVLLSKTTSKEAEHNYPAIDEKHSPYHYPCCLIGWHKKLGWQMEKNLPKGEQLVKIWKQQKEGRTHFTSMWLAGESSISMTDVPSISLSTIGMSNGIIVDKRGTISQDMEAT